MTDILLPALYLDDFVLEVVPGEGVILINEVPEYGSVDVDDDANVVFQVAREDLSAYDIDLTTLDVLINGVAAVVNGVAQAGFTLATANVGTVALGARAASVVQVTIGHTAPWASQAVIPVDVYVESKTGPSPGQLDHAVFYFTVEDTIAPRLLSAVNRTVKVVRVTFNEPMLAVDAAGIHDALNPALYVFSFIADNDKQAGAAITAVSVAAVSSTVFDVTLDWEASFWRTYRLTCGAIADDSSNANELDAAYRTADFDSWTPSWWPVTRRWSIWTDMLDASDRQRDTQGDLERMVSIWQDTLDLLLYDIDSFEHLWDVDRANESVLDAMLADLGNPFQVLDLEVDKKRKLIDVLSSIYMELGSADSIIDLARFFLGLTVTVVPYMEYAWIVGVSEVGVDTYAGPAVTLPERFWFWVNTDRALTATERTRLNIIVRRCKGAQEHFSIVEP